MNLYDITRTVPAVTAAAWFGAVLLQVTRGRIRTLTEKFFVVGVMFGGLYCVNDWIFLNTETYGNSMEGAAVLARLALSYLTLGSFFFLLFMKAFHSRPDSRDIVFLVPTISMLIVCWTYLVRGARPAAWGWKAVFDTSLFVLWVAYGLLYMILGVRYIYKISATLKQENPRLGKKTKRMALMFIAVIMMGASSNVLFLFIGLDVPPLFSSLLLVPGLGLVLVLSPLSRDQVAVFIRRWKARAYEVHNAFLVYENGTLIASRSEEDESKVDKDIFTATLDAIQSFMRTSFPLLRGKWLKTIEHGSVKILLERGQRVYLAVVIAGEENDQLRSVMRAVVNAVESKNVATLPNWSGVPEAVVGTREALGTLFDRGGMPGRTPAQARIR